MTTRRAVLIGVVACLGALPARAQHTGQRPPSGHAGGAPAPHQGTTPQGPAHQQPGAKRGQHAGQPAGAAHGAQAAGRAGAPADQALKNAAERALGAVGRERWRQAHRIEPRQDGGRIVIELDRDDQVAVGLVRVYVRELARQFSAGKHWLPGFGLSEPRAGARAPVAPPSGQRAEARDLPRGAELVWTSSDAGGVQAIQQALRMLRAGAGSTNPR